jgi:hypothetical protein
VREGSLLGSCIQASLLLLSTRTRLVSEHFIGACFLRGVIEAPAIALAGIFCSMKFTPFLPLLGEQSSGLEQVTPRLASAGDGYFALPDTRRSPNDPSLWPCLADGWQRASFAANKPGVSL